MFDITSYAMGLKNGRGGGGGGGDGVKDVKVNGVSVVAGDVASIVMPVDTSDLTNDGDGTSPFATQEYVDGRDPFMLLDFNQAVSGGVLTPCTDDTMPTSAATGRIDITLREDLQADWAIASLAKYEIKNGSTRVPAFPVASFSMTQQTVLRVLFKTAGTVTKDFTSISGAILLKHR